MITLLGVAAVVVSSTFLRLGSEWETINEIIEQ